MYPAINVEGLEAYDRTIGFKVYLTDEGPFRLAHPRP